MSTASAEPRLVDREFKPDELPPAEVSPLMVPERQSELAGNRPPRLAVRLAVGAIAAILGLYLIDSTVTFAIKAVTEGSIFDAAYLVAMLALVGSLGYLTVQQTKALRKLRSAEQARELATHLARLDSAGSGMRLLAAL